jgi:hypothetical protein
MKDGLLRHVDLFRYDKKDAFGYLVFQKKYCTCGGTKKRKVNIQVTNNHTMATALGSTATVSLTTAFIDLSTFDEIECWLYGGKSVNRFRKVIRKSAWFTVIAAQCNR